MGAPPPLASLLTFPDDCSLYRALLTSDLPILRNPASSLAVAPSSPLSWSAVRSLSSGTGAPGTGAAGAPAVSTTLPVGAGAGSLHFSLAAFMSSLRFLGSNSSSSRSTSSSSSSWVWSQSPSSGSSLKSSSSSTTLRRRLAAAVLLGFVCPGPALATAVSSSRNVSISSWRHAISASSSPSKIPSCASTISTICFSLTVSRSTPWMTRLVASRTCASSAGEAMAGGG